LNADRNIGANSGLIDRLFKEELASLKEEMGSEAYIAGRVPEAAKIFEKASTAVDLPEFLTLPAYDILEK